MWMTGVLLLVERTVLEPETVEIAGRHQVQDVTIDDDDDWRG